MYVSDGIEQHTQAALTLKEQFLLTLMKLRLNLREIDLAMRFSISTSSASRYFQKWVTIMNVRLVEKFIRWPERDEIRTSLPRAFLEHFSKLVAIIDCFEIPMNMPSNLLDKVSVFSNYKHRHTAKYLIGILPQGSVLFISKGYGGRTSDKYIVEDSGFLDNLRPGNELFNVSLYL